jgi:hypothetical protein
MADRSVTVTLVAKISDYERGMAAATAATKKFESELKDLRGKASVDLAHVGETAGDVSRDMTEMAATTAVAAHEIEKVGDNASEAGRDMMSLAARIEVAKAALHGLSLEFAGSGDKSLTPKIRQARRELSELERVAKTLTPGGPGGGAGPESLLSGLGGIGSSLRGALIPVAIGAVVALAPMIGATIAGAVVGGIGAGGIAGGIAMAARDPRVKAAGAEFAAHASDVFRLGGIAFVGPTVESLHILQQGLDRLHLGDALAPLAKMLPDVARGISGFATEAMPGLNRAIAAAGPALAIISEQLPKVGKAFGDMVGDISQSKGAMDGLRFIFVAVEGSLGGLGKLVAGLSDTFHGLESAGASLFGALEDIVTLPGMGKNSFFAVLNDQMETTLGLTPKVTSAWDGIPGRMDAAAVAAGRLGDQTERNEAAQKRWTDTLAASATAAIATGAATAGLTASFQAATRAAGGLVAAWDALHGRELSADEALLAAKEAVDALGASFKANKGKIDGNSEAALNNRIAMGNAGKAAADAAQKYVEAGGSINGARKIMEEQKAAAIKSAIANGGNAAAVHKLAGEMFKLPKNVTAKITVNGTQTAKNAVDALIRSINNVNSKTVTVTTQMRVVGAPVKGFASGTPSAPPGLSWVGERGPELMSLVGGERVFPHGQSMSMARHYAGGTGGSTSTGGPVNLTVNLQVDNFGNISRKALISDAKGRGVGEATIKVAYP